MIRLDATNRKLQAVLSGAITTSQLPCTVSYSDKTSTDYVGATQLTNTNSTTQVDICAAPAASTVRDIDYVSIKNVDTAAATVSVIYDDNTTDYTIAKCVLAVGDQLTYTHGNGWQVIASDGTLKTGAGLADGDKGDITVSSGTWTIDNDVVTYAKMQNVSATDKLLGRSTAGAGDPEEIACTAFARSILDDADEATFKATVNLEIGTDVQAYDADLSAIAALAKSDGNIIVGDGAAWVAESGATARTSLGLGTGDSPQFSGVNLGHASDTTLTRVSAGVIAVEGVNAVLAGAVTTNGITMSTARLLGRSTAATGAIEEITVGSGLSLAAGSLTATGGASAMPQNYITGLTLSNNGTDATNDIDIAIGSARDSTNAEDIVLASALTKRLDAAWAVGTNQGGLDTGSIANGTYHMWLIKRSDTDVVDVLFSTSATAPTMPTNYDYKRRIGSILRESSAIVGFVQSGIEFVRKVPINSVNATSVGSTAVTRTLNTPVGIKTSALIGVCIYISVGSASASATAYGIMTDLATTDTAPSETINHVSGRAYSDASSNGEFAGSSEVRVVTNTSSQIRSRVVSSPISPTLTITTIGWGDYQLLVGA